MVIQSKKVWLADQFVPAAIEVNDGRITAILPYGTKDVDDDYGDKRIVPGFMDIHCHGAYEFDTNDANEDGLRYWAEHIVSEGVTSFLATTITQSVEVLTNAVTNVANVMESGYDGAEILGIHFEGPYLDMKYKGAQPDQYIVKPTIEQFEHYQKAARGHIRYVTLATEHDEDFALTRYLTAHGVVVSIGHSGATYEQAVMAYANGARSMTHVYNGMSPFNHRANGLVGQQVPVRRQRDHHLPRRQRPSDGHRRSGRLHPEHQQGSAHPRGRGSGPLQLRSELLHHQPGQVPASGRPQGIHSGGQGRRPRGAGR